ncbi:MAG: NAD(P)-dependent oxidoreductase [Pirellulaceae bacterium]
MRADKCIVIAESEGMSPAAIGILRQLGGVRLGNLDRCQLMREVQDADVLWVRLRHRIDHQLLSQSSRLKVIVSPTTGLNHIDLAAAAERGIHVLSLRGEVDFLRQIRATAELTIGLMLALLRHIPQAVQHVETGGWSRDLFQGRELYGKTVGIVGLGRLGTIVAGYLAAFGARILATDPRPLQPLPDCVKLVDARELLRQSDIVSLHVDLCDATQGFWGKEQFEQMKRGAWFVNTSRGELIDERALLWALQGGHLAGAALDVLAGEDAAGMAMHPLVVYAGERDNLIITPHLGGCTAESQAKTEDFMASKLRDFCLASRDESSASSKGSL